MGMLGFLLMAVLSAVIFFLVRQKLNKGTHSCREAFLVLQVALACRHQAVKKAMEAAQIYLLRQADLGRELAQANADAEQSLNRASKFFSESSLSDLCVAETRLNTCLRDFQKMLEQIAAQRSDKSLRGYLENLDAVEDDVVTARHEYNRAVWLYNRLTEKFPMNVIVRMSGYPERLALVEFKDNNVAQMSRHLWV